MIENPVFFYISATILIFFTLGTICLKNVIYSLLCAIVVFFSGALFFYILGSEYNAIVQAIVYGLAVPVIIGISIMFGSGLEKSKNTVSDKQKRPALSYITILCGGIFILAAIYVIMISLAELPDTFNIVELPQVNSYDVLSSFAKGIFIDYVWAFELLSLLLTIVIAGLTIFKKRGA